MGEKDGGKGEEEEVGVGGGVLPHVHPICGRANLVERQLWRGR
jgi:hypothetical protein